MTDISKLKAEAEHSTEIAVNRLYDLVEENYAGCIVVVGAIMDAVIAKIALQAAEKEEEAHKSDPVQQFSQACAKEPRLEKAFIDAMLSVRDKYGTDPAPIADDGWIKWEGGECPVPPYTQVMIKFRSGKETNRPDEADVYYWNHDGDSCDIIAYRIVTSAADRVEE